MRLVVHRPGLFDGYLTGRPFPTGGGQTPAKNANVFTVSQINAYLTVN
jgi:hypothetical protein